MRFFRFATIDLRPLRHRDFSLLMAGQLVSYLGTQFTVVALPFQVFQLTARRRRGVADRSGHVLG